MVIQHVVKLKGDLFFVVRAELRETRDESGGVVVWQAESLAGVTTADFGGRDVLQERITQVVVRALQECRR